MISRDDVRKLANLARIKVLPEEEEKLAKDMENILGYVNQVQEISASAESTEKEKTRNVFRDDTVAHESGIHTETILKEAPQRQGNHLKVKKILS